VIGVHDEQKHWDVAFIIFSPLLRKFLLSNVLKSEPFVEEM
jgi:hypothetical protein